MSQLLCNIRKIEFLEWQWFKNPIIKYEFQKLDLHLAFGQVCFLGDYHFVTTSSQNWNEFLCLHVVTWQDRDRFCKHCSSICRSGPSLYRCFAYYLKNSGAQWFGTNKIVLNTVYNLRTCNLWTPWLTVYDIILFCGAILLSPRNIVKPKSMQSLVLILRISQIKKW